MQKILEDYPELHLVWGIYDRARRDLYGPDEWDAFDALLWFLDGRAGELLEMVVRDDIDSDVLFAEVTKWPKLNTVGLGRLYPRRSKTSPPHEALAHLEKNFRNLYRRSLKTPGMQR